MATNHLTTAAPARDLQACFAQLAHSGLTNMANRWADVSVPDVLAEKTAERPGGSTIALTYRQRRHQRHGHIARFMHLAGPKVEVQTLFLYPAADRLLPVLAAETVVIGGRAQVLVLDMPLLLCADEHLQEATASAMQALALQFAISSDTEAPDWYQSCRSGHDIFLRSPAPEASAAFDAYAAAATHTWLDWMAEAPEHFDAPAHAQAIADYKHHHREHSPGVALMSRCFGPEWTEAFMRAFFA